MTSVNFHQQGEVCVAARNDGIISVINCLSGMYVHNQQFGYCIAPFSKTDEAFILVAACIDNTIGSLRRS